MKKIFFILILISAFFSELIAQAKVDFSGQIRPRLILDDRDFNSGSGINSFTELRSRLGAEFNPINNLTGFIQIQDSRVFGTEPSTLSNTSNIDLHQAYFLIDNLFDLPLNLKVGRMEAAYGNQRLMGAVGWSNVGRSFDGLTLQFNINDAKLDLFAFREVESGQISDSSDQNVIGSFGEFNLFGGHKLQPFVIYYSSYSAAYPFNTFTFGTNFLGKIGGFNHEAEFAFQTGSEVYDGPRSVSAFLAAYNFNYRFNSEVKPSIGAGIDYLSGDDNQLDNDYKVFNTLFATNHKYYGFMDYFLNLPANTNGLGLIDIHGHIGFVPANKLSIKAIYHLFNSAEEATFANGNTSKSFGSEIDLVINYNYNANVNFQLGFGYFSPGEIFETTQGKDASTWGYLMAVVNL